MKHTHAIVAVIGACISLAADAANQGSLGATSTGSITVAANGPATPRQVQVLNLLDPSFDNSSRAEIDGLNPGITRSFCVVDTYTGAVGLNVATTNGTEGNGWKLTATSGQTVEYRIAITRTNTSPIGETNSLATSFTFNVPAGIAVADSAACGSGNIKYHVYLLNGNMPQSLPARTYTDVVTLTLTPQ